MSTSREEAIRWGLESDGGARFFCGGGAGGKLRVVRRPKAHRTAGKPK